MRKVKKYKWEVVAEDFDSPYLRNYMWAKAYLRFPKLFGIPVKIWGIACRNGHAEYIGNMANWTKAHNILKSRTEKDIYYVEKIIDKTNKLGVEFNKWSEREIFKKDLTKSSGKKLMGLLKEFSLKWEIIQDYGAAVVALDFQGFSFVEGNLEKILKAKVGDGKTYAEYFKVFTYPSYNSFAQDQEEDLLRMIIKYDGKSWRQDIQSKTLEELKGHYPKFLSDIKKHTKKYGWVYYNFAGPAFSEKHFFEFIKESIKTGVNSSKKLEEIIRRKNKIRLLKDKYIRKLNPDRFEKMILNLAGTVIWAKPRRKDFQSKGLYHLDNMMKEVARRLQVSFSQTKSMPFSMIEDGLKGRKVDVNRINSISKFHILTPENSNKVLFLYGKAAEKFYSSNIKKSEAINKNITEFKGNMASPGIKRGSVKIINQSSDMVKMNNGDILVSVATTPSIVPAMKKAAAIVTDEGGLTCHASIVSRELGITCVVGTKTASKVLKDGDLVEVDADKGIVRILK